MNKFCSVIWVIILFQLSSCINVNVSDSPNQSRRFAISLVTLSPSIESGEKSPTPTQIPSSPTKTAILTNTPSPYPSNTVSPASTFTVTTSPTITPSSTSLPVAIVITDFAYIRPGDSPAFRATATVKPGIELTILGRNEDATWIKVSLQDGLDGWINLRDVEVNIPIEMIEVIPSPPTPTPNIIPTTARPTKTRPKDQPPTKTPSPVPPYPGP